MLSAVDELQMERRVVLALECLLGVLLIDLAIRVVAVWLGSPVFEHSPPLRAEIHPPDPEASQFTCQTTDGLTLQGSLYIPPTPPLGVIVFCQEFGSDRWSALSYLQGAFEQGFVICSFDFRNQGESDELPDYRPLHWPTEYEVSDTLAVIQYLKSQTEFRDLPLCLSGVSRGGGVALVAASRSKDVLRVVSDGAFSVQGLMMHFVQRWVHLYLPNWVIRCIPLWHVKLTQIIIIQYSQWRRHCVYANVERALTRLKKKPVLMISGERDNYVPQQITFDLQSRTRQPRERVWIVPAAAHNRCRSVNPTAYDARICHWFLESVESRPSHVPTRSPLVSQYRH